MRIVMKFRMGAQADCACAAISTSAAERLATVTALVSRLHYAGADIQRYK